MPDDASSAPSPGQKPEEGYEHSDSQIDQIRQGKYSHITGSFEHTVRDGFYPNQYKEDTDKGQISISCGKGFALLDKRSDNPGVKQAQHSQDQRLQALFSIFLTIL